MDDLGKWKSLFERSNSITVLTGAGISAESGIPTFRGKDGFWIAGSKNFTPQDFATFSFFQTHPVEVLEWYKERHQQIASAKPNPGHFALATLEQRALNMGKSFLIITQNIDNLHRKAGSKNVAEIHGNIFKFRCSTKNSRDGHHFKVFDLDLSEVEDVNELRCKLCRAFLRPNVLWFDEVYDPRFFDVELAENHFGRSDLLLVIGTTLQTTFPFLLVEKALIRGIPIVEVNPDPILDSRAEISFAYSAAEILPKMVQ